MYFIIRTFINCYQNINYYNYYINHNSTSHNFNNQYSIYYDFIHL